MYTMTPPLVSQLFDFVSYYCFSEGITGYYMCMLKRDLCPQLLAGQIVDDIVVYSDGWMDVFVGFLKFRFQLSMFVQTYHVGIQYAFT